MAPAGPPGVIASESGEPLRPGDHRKARERTAQDTAYWQAGQEALPFETSGAIMKPHEIEFAEAFLASGNAIERWMPAPPPDPATGRIPAHSDFEWTPGLMVELKRSENLQTIRRPNGRVRSGLAKMRPHTGVPEIWGFWDGHLVRIK